jgi:hypothetical protein
MSVCEPVTPPVSSLHPWFELIHTNGSTKNIVNFGNMIVNNTAVRMGQLHNVTNSSYDIKLSTAEEGIQIYIENPCVIPKENLTETAKNKLNDAYQRLLNESNKNDKKTNIFIYIHIYSCWIIAIELLKYNLSIVHLL